MAALTAAQHPTMLWARRRELADTINSTSENPDYLPGRRLPYGLHSSSDLEEVIDGAEVVVMGTPSHGFREVFSRVAPGLGSSIPVVSLVKGIEQSTLLRMSQVVMELAPDHDHERIGMLTGPNLATEVMDGAPTAAVIAMPDRETGTRVQGLLMGPTFRVYTGTDVVGCELAGALKNVMAIAAGMAKGLGFGHNTVAALVTRALAEITRLGVALGGRAETFSGLAGMGDLVATCQSDESRNNRVGMALAGGDKLDEIVAEMKMIAEGVKTVVPVLELAKRAGVEMPIAEQVYEVLYHRAHPRESVLTLMTRSAKAE